MMLFGIFAMCILALCRPPTGIIFAMAEEIWAETMMPSWGPGAAPPTMDICALLTVHNYEEYAYIAKELRRGYSIWYEWVDKEYSTNVKFTILSGETRPEVSLNATEDLLDQGVRLFLGLGFPQINAELVSIISDRKAAMLIPWSTFPQQFNSSPSIFSLYPHLREEHTAVLQRIAQVAGTNLLVAVLLGAQHYLLDHCQGIQMQAHHSGLRYAGDFSFQLGVNVSTNWDQALQAFSNVPDIVISCLSAEESTELISVWKKRDWTPQAFVCSECISNPIFVQMLNHDALFTLGTFDLNLSHFRLDSADIFLNQRYENLYNMTVSLPAKQGFVAGNLMYTASQIGGDPRNYLSTATYGQNRDRLFTHNGSSNQRFQAVQLQKVNDITRQVTVTRHTVVFPFPRWSLRECLMKDFPNSGLTGFNATSQSCTACRTGELRVWTDAAFGTAPAWTCSPPCPDGTERETGGTCAMCASGKYGASGTCLQCQPGYYSEVSGVTECTACPVGKIANESFAVNCTSCSAGRFMRWGENKCTSCGVGKFASAQRMTSCSKCLWGSYCSEEGMSLPYNLVGWWTNPFGVYISNSESSLKEDSRYLPCTGYHCLSKGFCKSGHTGPWCEICLPGFNKGADRLGCSDCSDYGWALLAIPLGALSNMVFIYILAAFAIQSVGKTRSITSALMKLMMNYMVIICTTTSVTFSVIYYRYKERLLKEPGAVGPGPFVDNVMLLLRFNIMNAMFAFEGHCVFQPSLSAHDKNIILSLATASHTQYFSAENAKARDLLQKFHQDTDIRQSLFWLFSPLLMTCLILFIGFIAVLSNLSIHRQFYGKVFAFYGAIQASGFEAARQGYDRSDIVQYIECHETRLLGIYDAVSMFALGRAAFLTELWEQSKPVIIVGVFCIYPFILTMMTLHYDCFRPIDGKLGIVRRASPELRCFQVDDAHFWLSSMGTVGIGLGFPLVAFWYISTEVKQGFHNIQFQRTWGFLVSGYETDYAYWECVSLLRKFVMVCMGAIGYNEGTRALVVLLVSALFLLLHIWNQPFDTRFDAVLDRLESRQLILWVTFCIGNLLIFLCSDDFLVFNVNFVVAMMAALYTLYGLHALRHIVRYWRNTYADHLLQKAHCRHEIHRMSNDVETPALRISADVKILPQLVMDEFGSRNKLVTDSYEHYLDRKPCLCVDNLRMWVTVLGRFSRHHKPVPWPDNTALSAADLPEDISAANEAQRRYLLNIIGAAFKHVLVTQGMSTFSSSLLEFIIRVGFAFNSEGKHRGIISKGEQKMKNFVNRVQKLNPQTTSKSVETYADTAATFGDLAQEVEREVQLESSMAYLTEEECRLDVRHMFDPVIFKTTVSLQEFQLNLTKIMKTTGRDLHLWLDVFEHEWRADMLRRMRTIQEPGADRSSHFPVHQEGLRSRTKNKEVQVNMEIDYSELRASTFPSDNGISIGVGDASICPSFHAPNSLPAQVRTPSTRWAMLVVDIIGSDQVGAIREITTRSLSTLRTEEAERSKTIDKLSEHLVQKKRRLAALRHELVEAKSQPDPRRKALKTSLANAQAHASNLRSDVQELQTRVTSSSGSFWQPTSVVSLNDTALQEPVQMQSFQAEGENEQMPKYEVPAIPHGPEQEEQSTETLGGVPEVRKNSRDCTPIGRVCMQ